MALSIEDMRDWLAILRAHPEWKAEVRREVLSEELLSLPDLIRQNGEDIRELKESILALREQAVQESAETRRNSAEIRQNSVDIRELKESVLALKEVVARNSADILQNSVDIRELKEVVAQNSAGIRQNSADIQALKEVVAQNSADLLRFGADLSDLREVVRQNSADIRELVGIIGRNSLDIRGLTEVVSRNGADIQALKDVVAENSADIRQLTEVVDKNTSSILTMTVRMDALVGVVTRLDGRLGSLDGRFTEMDWSRNFQGRFGRLVSRGRLVTADELDAFYRAWDDGTLTDADAASVRNLDIIIQGTEGRGMDKRPVVVAVEVSMRLEEDDLERVVARSEVLRSLGYNNGWGARWLAHRCAAGEPGQGARHCRPAPPGRRHLRRLSVSVRVTLCIGPHVRSCPLAGSAAGSRSRTVAKSW